jgi:cell division protein FtsQ
VRWRIITTIKGAGATKNQSHKAGRGCGKPHEQRSAASQAEKKERSFKASGLSDHDRCDGRGISVFFKISHIEVKGNTRYTAEEIISASSLQQGDSLFFVNSFRITNQIFSALPYVDEATISKELPDTIVIGIEESVPLACVAIGAGYYIINNKCKILEKTDRSGSIGTITVKGVEPILPTVGEKLALGQEAAHKISYLSDVLELIEERQMQADIEEIDLSDGANLTFSYLDRFTIELGRQEGTEYKLDQLNEVLEHLSPGETGRIILATGSQPHFIPD